jgi:hypothetical protein
MISTTRHEWIKKYPPGFHERDGAPSREWWRCKNCDCIRLGDPLPDSVKDRVGGPHLVWNRSDFCDADHLVAAAESRARCSAGAGIEHFAAFFGSRPVDHLFHGDE